MWLVGQVSLATPPEVVTRIPASVDWGLLAGSSRHNAKLTSGLAERRVRFPYALPIQKKRGAYANLCAADGSGIYAPPNIAWPNREKTGRNISLTQIANSDLAIRSRMLYPIEPWCARKALEATSRAKLQFAPRRRLAAYCSLGWRGDGLQADGFQVQRVPAVRNRAHSQSHFPGRGDFEDAEPRNSELAIVASGGSGARAGAVTCGDFERGSLQGRDLSGDIEFAGPGDLERPVGPIGKVGPETEAVALVV